MQEYMEMSRFASRQSISQSLPGRALGAIAQGGASLVGAGASSAASAVARAAPVVASAGVRAGSSAIRATSAGVRKGAALTSAAARAVSQVPSRVMSEIRARGVDENVLGDLLTAPRARRAPPSDRRDLGDRRARGDMEDIRARVMRQALA
jgi:hypothetical protein